MPLFLLGVKLGVGIPQSGDRWTFSFVVTVKLFSKLHFHSCWESIRVELPLFLLHSSHSATESWFQCAFYRESFKARITLWAILKKKPNTTKPHKQTFRGYHAPFKNDLIISHLQVNLIPKDRSKDYQCSIPQTCWTLLGRPGSFLTLPWVLSHSS